MNKVESLICKLKKIHDINYVEGTNEIIIDKYKEIQEKSLHEYIKAMWGIIEPGIDFIDNWHIECMCEYLEAVRLGQINRLLINIPPRYMKSIAVTVAFPTWVWTTEPHKRIISLSYSATLSKKHNINRRDVIKNPWYKNYWNNQFTLKEDMNTQMKFENDKMGFMFATSVGGTLTGEGGDYIIVDDPHSPKQADSDAERESAIEFFKTTLPTRLNNKKKGAIIVVMQRLHENDVSGYCLESGIYEHLNLTGLSEKKEIITFPISLRTIERQYNEPLWEAREDNKELDLMKKALGSNGFSAQYQQNPTPTGGGEIKEKWFKYWIPSDMDFQDVEIKVGNEMVKIKPTKLPFKFDMILQSWDMNFKQKEGCDPIGCHIWANKGADIFLLDRLNKQVGFVETVKEVVKVTSKWKEATIKLIEEKANGAAVIDVLQHKIGGFIPIIPKESKRARLSAVSPWIEGGNVYIPHPKLYDWVNDFVQQCIKFPFAKNDEDIDCLSQALYRFIYSAHNEEEEKKEKSIEEIIFSDDLEEREGGYFD